MRGIRLTATEIAGHIREAGDTCLLITPRVDAIVAEALRERAQHTTEKAFVVIDGHTTPSEAATARRPHGAA